MTTRARAILSRLADAAKAKSDSALFRNMHDEPLRPYALREAFNGTLQRAGISDFHFHDLRHTFASRLVMAGVDLRTVQELMGHKTISMTLRYSHLSPDHKKSATNALEQRFPGKNPATFHNTPVSAPLSNVQKAV